MALSNKRILEEMEKGDIIISPFKRENLATSSYDLSLGEFFYREHPTKYNHSIYNIYSQSHTNHVWGGEDDVQRAVPASEAFEKYNFEWDGISPEDRVIILRPGETILAHTDEFVGGKDHITTMMKARSSLGRSFIEVCKCAGWGDVGYINRWTMEITNNSKNYLIPLVVGRRVAQLIFFETGPIVGADYAATGKYNPGKNLKELQKKWRPEMMLPQLYRDKDIKKNKISKVSKKKSSKKKVARKK